MAMIIAGGYPTLAQADETVTELLRVGVSRTDVHCLSLNPPGQHDVQSPSLAKSDMPSETSADEEPPREGAKGAARGAAIGGAVGLGIGMAAAPFAGPAGPIAGTGVGAYVGSLIGAMSGLEGPANERDIRRAGVLVAVRVSPDSSRQQIEQVFRDTHARQVELAEGTWQDGQWVNFDPGSEPVVIEPSTPTKEA